MPHATDALPEKTVRGSDHPYRIPPAKTWSAAPGVGILPSFAKGGHSTVWGASMLPYTQADLAGWPIGQADLAAHYRSVLRALPFSGEVDALAERFPLHGNPSGCVATGERMAGILRRAAAQPPVGRVLVGRSRLAVDARPAAEGGCHACGQCMHGCPDHLIFDSGDALTRLAAQGLVDYRSGIVVRQWRRSDGHLLLDLEDLAGTRLPSLVASRVFVGAGVLGTAEIVVRSRNLWSRPIRILDSQYFVGPLVSHRAERQRDLATLAQVFIEIQYGPDPTQSAHCQIYPPNQFVEAAIRARIPAMPGRSRAARRLAGRVFPVQGFLPSRDSGELSLVVDAPDSRGPIVAAHPSTASAAAVKVCAEILARQRTLLGGFFVARAVEVADVGRSFHIGGSFPMAVGGHAGPLSTDVLGRLPGESNVHLVDASILPSISGATITLTSMANAHRIAMAAATLNT